MTPNSLWQTTFGPAALSKFARMTNVNESFYPYDASNYNLGFSRRISIAEVSCLAEFFFYLYFHTIRGI